MKTKIKHCKSLLNKLNWFPPFLARLSLGIVFAESGWGKLHNLERVTDYFTSLNIPFAPIQAPFVAGLEFIGGLLLIFGLATRLVSFPLIVVMTVAIITAKLPELSSPSDVFGFSEYLYLVLLFFLTINGPGRISLDQIISKQLKEDI